MRLTDLEPKLNGDTLHFLCPKCWLTQKEHMIGAGKSWGGIEQPFETMTLVHSVRVIGQCEAHFQIIKGEIVMSPEGT